METTRSVQGWLHPGSEDLTATAGLEAELATLAPEEAAARLTTTSPEVAAHALAAGDPATAVGLLWRLDPGHREAILAAAPALRGEHWRASQDFPEDTVGRLMHRTEAVFPPELTVAQAVERLRELVRREFVTYAFVAGPRGRLLGVLVFRDLLLAEREQQVAEVMLASPFWFTPETAVPDAMREALRRHFPVYPVCDEEGRLIGVLRGQTLFEHQAYEISAQPGTLVGVDKEERLSTPWFRSLRFRHPWLQLNLLTAFIAAGVVGVFQGTLDRMVVLALFLPVLAGQSGNTGCQALAVALRGLTLGELAPGRERALVFKEGLLGLLNGALVGLTAAVGMFFVARAQANPHAFVLAAVVFLAMVGSCVISGIAGATIPLALRRLGADPATASSIFLTTATDVASMGLFLSLATWLVS